MLLDIEIQAKNPAQTLGPIARQPQFLGPGVGFTIVELNESVENGIFAEIGIIVPPGVENPVSSSRSAWPGQRHNS